MLANATLCGIRKLPGLIGPGDLRAPNVMVDGSEAGHCFHLLFSSVTKFYKKNKKILCDTAPANLVFV